MIRKGKESPSSPCCVGDDVNRNHINNNNNCSSDSGSSTRTSCCKSPVRNCHHNHNFQEEEEISVNECCFQSNTNEQHPYRGDFPDDQLDETKNTTNNKNTNEQQQHNDCRRLRDGGGVEWRRRTFLSLPPLLVLPRHFVYTVSTAVVSPMYHMVTTTAKTTTAVVHDWFHAAGIQHPIAPSPSPNCASSSCSSFASPSSASTGIRRSTNVATTSTTTTTATTSEPPNEKASVLSSKSTTSSTYPHRHNNRPNQQQPKTTIRLMDSFRYQSMLEHQDSFQRTSILFPMIQFIGVLIHQWYQQIHYICQTVPVVLWPLLLIATLYVPFLAIVILPLGTLLYQYGIRYYHCIVLPTPRRVVEMFHTIYSIMYQWWIRFVGRYSMAFDGDNNNIYDDDDDDNHHDRHVHLRTRKRTAIAASIVANHVVQRRQSTVPSHGRRQHNNTSSGITTSSIVRSCINSSTSSKNPQQ